MKKGIILLLILSMCGGSANDVVTESTTSTTIKSTTSTTIKELPLVEFVGCPESNLKAGDIYPLVIETGSSTADIDNVFINFDDESSGLYDFSFDGEDVSKKGETKTFSLNVEMYDFSYDYLFTITTYVTDVNGNSNGKVCAFIVEADNNCEDDADFIEGAYEQAELDDYYYYKDIEVDYSKPITLEEITASIELLEKQLDYYLKALEVRTGSTESTIKDLKIEDSYIDAVLYGMIANTDDSLHQKYMMKDTLEKNGPFNSNAEVTKWYEENPSFSAVNWRTTEEFIEFYQAKLPPGDGVGNHIVDESELPDSDWIVSDEYPKNTLRKKCETYNSANEATERDNVLLENFDASWKANMKQDILLSDYEVEVNEKFAELWAWAGSKWEAENENFYEIQINGVSCIRIYNSMGTALLDQNHPIAASTDRPKWNNRSHTYRCFLTEEQLEQPELIKKTDYLYGIPFFHQETWWIFQSVSSEFSFECDKPCSYFWYDFATLTPIDDNQELNSVISP